MLSVDRRKTFPKPAGKPKNEDAKSGKNRDADVAGAYDCFLHEAHNQKLRSISLTNHQNL